MEQKIRVRTLAKQNFHALWERAAKIAVPVAAIGGFVADVLSPLAPLVGMLTFLTGFLCVISGVVWFGFKRRQIRKALVDGNIDEQEFQRIGYADTWSVAFAFNLVASIVLVLFFGAQKVFASANPDRGLMASVMPEMAHFQAQLLGLKAQTEQIAATTQRLETKTDEMKAAIQKLDEKVVAAAQGAAQPAAVYDQKPTECAQSAKVSPYGKVFDSQELTVELATLAEKNEHGHQDVILRIRGPAAFEAGIDGKAVRYKTKTGFGGGLDYTYADKNGEEPVRMISRTNHEGEMYRVFLKDDKPFDLKLNPARSKSFCPSLLDKPL